MSDIITTDFIENRIFQIRGMKVMLSTHLAELYEVEHRVLMQAVTRNIIRFPDDFMFQLNNQEFANLKSQIVTSSWGGIRKHPHAFTEQGVAMLSSVLRSNRAIEVNIHIMRAFVKLRQILMENADISKRLDEMEKKYDEQFAIVFRALRKMIPAVKKKDIGFEPE